MASALTAARHRLSGRVVKKNSTRSDASVVTLPSSLKSRNATTYHPAAELFVQEPLKYHSVLNRVPFHSEIV